MIQQIPFPRGSKDYIAHKGLDDDSENIEYLEEVAKYPNNLTGRFFPSKKEIFYKPGKGNVKEIISYFQWALFADNGEMITEPKDEHPDFGTLMMHTNDADKGDFTIKFNAPFGVFDFNGFVRKIMGFNKYRLFNSQTGEVLIWTEEQLAEPPTHDYNNPTE